MIMPVFSILYKGKKYQCPVCGKKYRKLLPYGYVISRENALCPWCLALERHRQIWLYLNRVKPEFFTKEIKMLHIAPERCFMKRFEKQKNIDYFSADIESPLARIKMDIQAIPFEENTFDVIFCNHILEHVDDDRLAMREMRRVMKIGGWGILQSPINRMREVTYEDKSIVTEEERTKHFGQKDHVREYGNDYAQRMKEEGFSVEEVQLTDFLTPEEVEYYAVGDKSMASGGDIIYVVSKPSN